MKQPQKEVIAKQSEVIEAANEKGLEVEANTKSLKVITDIEVNAESKVKDGYK